MGRRCKTVISNLQMTKIKSSQLILLFIVLIICAFLVDVTEFDNFLYQWLRIHPHLPYYDLRIWDFYQGIGAVGALIFGIVAAFLAYRTWNLESKPNIQAVGSVLISLDEDTNGVRDNYMQEYNTLYFVNVGRGPARNIVPSVNKNTLGFLLEDYCPDTFSMAGNKDSKEMGLSFRVHGQRFESGNEYELEGTDNKRYFYIRYQDHSGTLLITKVSLDKVNSTEQEIGAAMSQNVALQLWKVSKNENVSL